MSDPTNPENEVAETANEPEATPAPLPYKAVLDANGVLIGYERTSGPGVEVPEDCDLIPGKYRWAGAGFVPIMEAFDKNEVSSPSTLAAIAMGLKAVRDGKPLPGVTLKWLDDFDKTIDAQGA